MPWQTNEQVEQDLVICRAISEIFSDEFLRDRLAFRGGTALHKLYLDPQPRYSEDIDLVQRRPEPIKETLVRIRERLSFLGEASVAQRRDNNTLKFRFQSEIAPIQNLRLKIEINCREHFNVLGLREHDYSVDSDWFDGQSSIVTYKLEELLGTKLRALYQRRKGRDLFDLYAAWQRSSPDADTIVRVYREYMKFSVDDPPTRKQFLKNLEAKMTDREFTGDTKALLRSGETYDLDAASEFVKSELIDRI